MSHWAEIDENNVVIRVVVGDNDDINGDEGYTWLVENLGGRWIKTSYNTRVGVHQNGGVPFRINYAGPGMIYREDLDGFIFPKPEGFNSWTLNEQTGEWVAPVPKPTDPGYWVWNEKAQNWQIFSSKNEVD